MQIFYHPINQYKALHAHQNYQLLPIMYFFESCKYPIQCELLTTTHFLVVEIGLCSCIKTLSPSLQLLFSSCAVYFLYFFITFLYSSSLYTCNTETFTVLSHSALVTVPQKTFLGILFLSSSFIQC